MQFGSQDLAGRSEPEAPRRRPWMATIFLGLFTAIGGFVAVVIVIDWLQGVSTYFWEESTCTIESSAVEQNELGEFEFMVSYRYHLRGEHFTGDLYRHSYTGSSSASDAHRLAARYAVGETVPCYVDADKPWNAYLKRANLWRGFLIFIPLMFVAIGGGSLYMVHGREGTSAAQPAGTPSSSLGKAKAAGGPIKVAVGMLILFGAFFLFGFGMFIPFFVWPALQVAEARFWTPVPCEIISSGVESHAGDDSTTYSVEALYRYRFAGQDYTSNRYQFMGGSSSGYEGKAEAAARIPAGSQTECYVDPDDPFEAVIHRGFSADYLFGLIPLLFGLIGAGGLWFAFQVGWGARRDAERPSWQPPPQALAAAGIQTGPITLEPRFGPLTKVVLALMVALFWNGIVSIFLWHLVDGWWTGNTDWFLAIFLTPFVLIGLLLLTGVPYSILALVNPRPRIHLSPGVLQAGESAQLDWSFRGASSRIQNLKIWLEGTRTERKSRGNETRSRSESFRTVEVLDRPAGLPLEFGSVSIRVPDDIEPTTEGDDAVTWKLKLQGRIAYWPDVIDEYEVRILGVQE